MLVAQGYGSQERKPLMRMTYEREAAMFNAIAQGRAKRATTHLSSTTSAIRRTRETRRVSDVITIRIGAVTGDGRYFLLNEERRTGLGLPVEAMVPILSRASHLNAAEVTRAHWESLRDAGDRVWLFRPPPRLLKHAAVDAYLALAQQDGGCNRKALQVMRREPASVPRKASTAA